MCITLYCSMLWKEHVEGIVSYFSQFETDFPYHFSHQPVCPL